MQRDVNDIKTIAASSSCSRDFWPAQCPGRDRGSLPRERNVPAAFSFACSTSSEAELQSQRQTDKYIQRTPIGPVTQTTTDKVLPSKAPMYRTHISYKSGQPCSLLVLDWQRQKVSSTAYVKLSPGSKVHTHLQIPKHQHDPSAYPAPLQEHQSLLPIPMSPQFNGWSSAVLAANMQRSHSCPIGTPLIDLPKYQYGPSTVLITAQIQCPSTHWLVQLAVC